VITVLQDIATLTPSVIVCAAFLIGVVMLVRHEMAPKRRKDEDAGPPSPDMAQAKAAGETNHDI
jgi:hypothetical protein